MNIYGYLNVSKYKTYEQYTHKHMYIYMYRLQVEVCTPRCK